MTAEFQITGELLTRVTIWLALVLYAAGEVARATRTSGARNAWAGWLNAAGCGLFLAHVALAFHYFHHWSHAVAYADTARQTLEFTGWNSGSGLFVNYLLAAVWLSEVIWWRASPVTFAARPAWITWSVRAFFLFMIFNGAFVFVHNPARWFGLLLCIVLTVAWTKGAKRKVVRAA